MKTTVFISVLFLLAAAPAFSFGQNQAMEDQKKAFGYLTHTSPALGYPTTRDMYMKASFGGIDWSALDMTPDRGAVSVYHVYATGKGQSVEFTVLIPDARVGYTDQFSETRPVNLIINDRYASYTATTGSYKIEEIDPEGFEVSFQCTAVSHRRKKTNTVEISKGYARCPFLRAK